MTFYDELSSESRFLAYSLALMMMLMIHCGLLAFALIITHDRTKKTFFCVDLEPRKTWMMMIIIYLRQKKTGNASSWPVRISNRFKINGTCHWVCSQLGTFVISNLKLLKIGGKECSEWTEKCKINENLRSIKFSRVNFVLFFAGNPNVSRFLSHFVAT